MSATTVFGDPFLYARDINGVPVVGAKWTFFEAGTSTPLAVYTDSDLSVAWVQPILSNAAGMSSGPVYCFLTPAMKVVAVTSADIALPGFPVDHISPAAVA